MKAGWRRGAAPWLAAGGLALAAAAADPTTNAVDPCAQPSPEEMARAAGVQLPHRPWHVVNIWWEFEKPTPHFSSLDVDVTVDRDVPSTYNLYLSPVGVAEINGLQFYGGLQSNINGWPDKESRERVHRGKGGIFSRWSADKRAPLSLDNVRPEPGGLVESADYEGSFASVRRPFAWTKGRYTYRIEKGATEAADGRSNTWFHCRVIDAQGKTNEIGALRFEGADFTFWPRHSAFLEVYATGPIPRSGIPKVQVAFGMPRLNGRVPALKEAYAFYPHDSGPAAPDCAWAKAEGSDVVVDVGPIFQRDPAKRRHDLPLKAGAGP